MTVYSQRNKSAPAALRFDLPAKVRRRLLHTLTDTYGAYQNSDLRSIVEELTHKLAGQYGDLCRPGFEAARISDDPVEQHFYSCNAEQALDFLEFWFQCRGYRDGNAMVEAINTVLREEGIGYELTPWVEKESSRTVNFFGRAVTTYEIQRPQVVRKDNQFTYSQIIEPTLSLLSATDFAVANGEMLDAFRKYREGDFADAITSCGSAFESVLKTICTKKGWPFDPERDTCSKLVDVCRQHDLFPPFYVEPMKAVGTIRNKLSDAHGRGPTPQYEVERIQVEHFIEFTASHILLLARLSGIV